jgi:hypothetical protein
MPKETFMYGQKAYFEDFYTEEKTTEELARIFGSEFLLKKFFNDQAGVILKLKYWHLRCVHFPVIDAFLNKLGTKAHNAAKTLAAKQKVLDEHPVTELLTDKPGTDEKVWEFWYLSTKEASPGEIILGAMSAIINTQDASDDKRDQQDLTNWCNIDKIDVTEMFGFTKKSDPNEDFPAYEQTVAGRKFLKLNGLKNFRTCWQDTPVLEAESPAAACSEDAYEIINYYYTKCDKAAEDHLEPYGEYLCSISMPTPLDD